MVLGFSVGVRKFARELFLAKKEGTLSGQPMDRNGRKQAIPAT
jgi:hypothetical protein